MFASELITILGKVEKLQKNHSSEDYECTNGVWFLYDAERQCIVMVAMTGHTLYWEKVFTVHLEYEKDLYEKLQNDLAKPDNERCFPCRIIKNDIAWISTLLKSYKNGMIWLEDFARDKDKLKLVFHSNAKSDSIELPARAAADSRSSVEGMLYKEMVRHGGSWADKYAPMEVGGWCCNTYPADMKLCMELMASKDKRHGEKPISLMMYGMYGEDKTEDGTPPNKYIEQNHWEILDANTDAPERGMIHMVVRQPDGCRKHYI